MVVSTLKTPLIDLNLSFGAEAFGFQGIGNSCKLSLLFGAGDAFGGPLVLGDVAWAVAGVGVVVVVVVVGFSGFFWKILLGVNELPCYKKGGEKK